VLLRDVHVFDEPEDAPGDFAPNIVQGKCYDADALDPTAPLSRALCRLTAEGVYSRTGSPGEASGPTATLGWGARRLGQRSFQVMVLSAYERRCAVTGDRIRPVLQAAHILPVAEGGRHRVDNGLLLRPTYTPSVTAATSRWTGTTACR